MKGKSEEVTLKDKEDIEEKKGKLAFQSLDNKLMHLILENDSQSIERGKVIQEALDSGFGALTVDFMMENLVKNYNWAKKLFGERLLRKVTGYDSDYLESNIRVPEFQRELRDRIGKRLEDIKKEGLLGKDGTITHKGVELASLLLFIEELEHLKTTYPGDRTDKKSPETEKTTQTKHFTGQKYKDISIKKTVRAAILRGHKKIERMDLRVSERKRKGEQYIVYALDASGSMKGDKIRNAKKAGIALAYRAIEDRAKVGLLIFGKDVKDKVMPGSNFVEIMTKLADVKSKEETDLAVAIGEATTMFPEKNSSKHLILLTDTLPTIGKKPEEETLREVSKAREKGITISLIGIGLNKEGEELSQRIVEIGKGRLYSIKDIEKLDSIVLQEYDEFRRN